MTGNSFGSEDAIDHLELTWTDLDIAKENLLRISEHYQMYRDINAYGYRVLTKDGVFAANENKDWFVNKPQLYCISTQSAIAEGDKAKVGDGNWGYRPDYQMAVYCLKLKADNGKPVQISAFWCGHFERLYEAEIELNNNDWKITF